MARYGFDYTPAYAGKIADASLRDIISLPAQVLNDEINKIDSPISFGLPVQALVSTYENEAYVKVVNNLTDHIIGIAVFSHCCENGKSNVSGEAFYRDKDVVSVLTKGRIWVYVFDNIKDGDIAYIAQPASGNCVSFFTNAPTNNKEIGIFSSNTVETINHSRIAILEFDLSAHAVGGL